MKKEALYIFNPQAQMIRNKHYENHKKLLDVIKQRENQFLLDKSKLLKKHNKIRSSSVNKHPLGLDNHIITRRLKEQEPSILFVQLKDEYKQHRKMLKSLKRVKSISKEKSKKKKKEKGEKNKSVLPSIIPRKLKNEFSMYNINCLPPLEKIS